MGKSSRIYEQQLDTVKRAANEQMAIAKRNTDETMAVAKRDVDVVKRNADVSPQQYRTVISMLEDKHVKMGKLFAGARKRLADTLCQLRAKSARYVKPPPDVHQEEVALLVAMAKSYCHTSTDPAYLEWCTHVFVRIQRPNVEVRMAAPRSMGKYGNQRASIVYIVETANAHVLFHRFKLHAAMANPKLDIRMFGCVLDGDAAEARAIELLQKTSDEKNSRVEGIDDDDDDDDSEEDDDGLGGGVFINGLGGCERLLTIEPVKKTDSVLSSPLV